MPLKYSGVTSGESKIVKIVVVEFWLTTICHQIELDDIRAIAHNIKGF